MALSNNPPVELEQDEAQFIADVLERDLGQSLGVLQLVMDGKLSEEAGRAAVAYTEKARPIFRKIREQLK